jgi:hypothetical protein
MQHQKLQNIIDLENKWQEDLELQCRENKLKSDEITDLNQRLKQALVCLKFIVKM